MTYRITIEEVLRDTVPDQEYHRVADSGNERDNGPVYEYVEHGTKTETTRRTLLQQEVDELNLPAVIRAVNGL